MSYVLFTGGGWRFRVSPGKERTMSLLSAILPALEAERAAAAVASDGASRLRVVLAILDCLSIGGPALSDPEWAAVSDLHDRTRAAARAIDD
jgi:hypothetical protein